MKTKLLFFIFLCFSISSALGQGLKGSILDEEGNPIPFVSIYTSDAKFTTASNESGNYSLRLPKGEYEITFQHLSYQNKVIKAQINGTELQNQDVVLMNQSISLATVSVTGKSEDPAYAIMRKTISLRSYYLNLVESYSAKAYVKGSASLEKVPKVFKWMLDKEMRKSLDILLKEKMIVESIAEVEYKNPNQYKNKILSTKSNLPDTDFDPLPMVMSSIYEERFVDVLSPLARSAFSHYRFEYEGFFEDHGITINKIKVIPRQKGLKLFNGHIYIAEELWNVHSANLQFDSEFGLINMKQSYAPVSENVWMPVTFDILGQIEYLGVELDVQYLVSVSDYEIKLNKSIQALSENKENSVSEAIVSESLNNREMKKLEKEVRKSTSKKRESLEIKKEDEGFLDVEVDSLAYERDSIYWEEIRPIPLTLREEQSYIKLDTLKFIESNNEVDSSKASKIGKVFDSLIFGVDLAENDSLKKELRYLGLLQDLEYNTVDGLKMSTGLKFTKDYENNELEVVGKTRYAFSRKVWLGIGEINYKYAPLSRGEFSIKGGRDVVDFNEETGMNTWVNVFGTLILKENLKKFYQKDFLKLDNTVDIANGLVLTTTAEWAYREALRNHSGWYFFPWDREFTPNAPENKEIDNTSFDDHAALIFSGKLAFTPQYYYRIIDGKKRMAYSKFPTFEISYTKGVPKVLNSQVNFDELSFNIQQTFDLGVASKLRYKAVAGTFINNSSVFFMDFMHFNSVQLPVYFGENFGRYRLLNYYEYSTEESYFQLFGTVYADRILLKRLPWLNKTFIRELFFANYLYTPVLGNYVEIGYGVDNVFTIASLELATAIVNDEFKGVIFKVGFKF
ncbi:DUF5686 and carboxypeptidase regulatory-like domain-containing protein [Aureibacter tunicatorum]|uniref:Carboxypeptidase-like regulatory domain-containing protein n=1 Tax=Aureibacter tunicatorum TaxID=866807 RepID=A0AAE3XK11_9BACT|nr:DUF5686 and carboxypeptidase regulatory-like domain-containing protein [Aureibacter tunicatorum]MDR6237419.1 hypothetical protein [Aureibacter tunicatorum]BDD06409.1 hypothetical protein AUTU_38920 [Aureibacter tunicatorum]